MTTATAYITLAAVDPTTGDPKELTESAIRALRYAREALKAAGASKRCVDRVRRALSSAEGAHRHAVNKSYREGRACIGCGGFVPWNQGSDYCESCIRTSTTTSPQPTRIEQ